MKCCPGPRGGCWITCSPFRGHRRRRCLRDQPSSPTGPEDCHASRVLKPTVRQTFMYKWNPQDYAQNSRGQEAWARELISLIDLRPDDVVLDVGCGDGRITASIANNVPRGSVVGVDLSADMLAHASRQHGQPTHGNLRFQQADAAALPFVSEFSVVFSNATLHWVPDQRAAIQGIARALRPEGRFVAQMGGQGNFADLVATFEHLARTPRWREVVRYGEIPYRFNHPT